MKMWEACIEKQRIAMLYIGVTSCNVCHAMKPKIEKEMEKDPKVGIFEVNLDEIPEISGKHLVFAVPTLILFCQGKEIYRASRFIDIKELGMRLKVEVER